MSKLGIILGVLLMIVAFGVLGGFIISATSEQQPEFLRPFQNAIFCSGDTYIVELGGMVYNSSGGSRGQSVEMFCENNENQRRDVSGQVVAMGMLGFVIPFIIGLIMLISGLAANARTRIANMMSSPLVQVPISTGTKTQYIVHSQNLSEKDAAAMIQQVMQGLQQASGQVQVTNTSGGDLTSRLRQLEEARDAGLISLSEYERVRQQILDRMDD